MATKHGITSYNGLKGPYQNQFHNNVLNFGKVLGEKGINIQYIDLVFVKKRNYTLLKVHHARTTPYSNPDNRKFIEKNYRQVQKNWYSHAFLIYKLERESSLPELYSLDFDFFLSEEALKNNQLLHDELKFMSYMENMFNLQDQRGKEEFDKLQFSYQPRLDLAIAYRDAVENIKNQYPENFDHNYFHRGNNPKDVLDPKTKENIEKAKAQMRVIHTQKKQAEVLFSPQEFLDRFDLNNNFNLNDKILK